MIYTDSSNFEEDVKVGKKVVLLKADWSSMSTVQQPLLESKCEDCLIIADIDSSRDIADRFGITTVPSIILMEDGKVVEVKEGYTNEYILDELLSEYFG